MIEQIPFTGFMNLDDPNNNLPKGHHKTAKNLLFKGVGTDLRPENIPGTRQISFSLPSGTNVEIGRFYDEVNKRVFYFNYNSNGTHGIYIINYDESISTLIQTGTNTTGDPLGFDPSVTIDSIDMYYGDASVGDILMYVDSLQRPTKINVDRYLAGTYNPIVRSYIDVAKAPPQMPIKPVYENDTTVNVNNLRNTLFQFIYRYVYDDNEKSVWSSASIVPLPFQPYSTLTQNDYTLNSRISLFISTGATDVKKIEVAFRYVKDGQVSDYFLISSFNKADLSIPDNDIYWYKFYNGDSYTPIDVKEQLLLQSFVPQKAGCQSLINGNVLSYANITEGYNLVKASLSVSSPVSSGNSYYFDYNGLLFFATISGVDSGTQGTTLKIYLYGTGTNTAGSVTTLNNGAAYYNINVVNGSGTSIGTSYLNSTDNPTVSSILTAVSAALVTNGFTQVSLVGNILTMSYPTAVTLYSSGTGTTGTGFASPTNAATTKFSYAFQSNYTLGLMYFDSKGRTNGAIISSGGSFQTAVDNGSQNMSPQLTISHRPPTWATYYQVIRTANLTYNKRLNWVTNGAYSDANANALGVRYAYLEIDNINQYNELIKATEGVVGYTFAQGDRVRISGRFDATGTPATLNATYDYEVLGTVNSFVLNGITKIGTFVQIYYPTADIDGNFKLDGTGNFQNYQILLYNYAQHEVGIDKEVYFEFGKCFGIGNSGTTNAYHIGLEQTQTANLGTPAKVTVANGDLFARQRVVPIGQTALITCTGIANGFYYVRPVATTTTVTNSVYTIHSATGAQANPPLVASYDPAANFFLNNSANPITVRLRSSIPVTVDLALNTSVLATISTSGPTEQVITLVNPIAMSPSVGYTVEVDSYVTVPANGYLNILIVNSANVVNQKIATFTLTLDVILNVTIPIIESSFSDVYNMVINSDGRPSVYDPNARQTTNGTLFRFSRPYEFNTNINGMSTFYELNYDQFVGDYGDVIRMRVNGKELRIFQQIRVGVVGIYGKYIKDQSGANTLVVTDAIITPNNIQYYIGNHGLGNQPSALVSVGNVDYFPSVSKGHFIRLATEPGDGMTSISETYKIQSFAGTNLPKYLTGSTYAYGGKAKIVGCVNYLKDRHFEVIFCLQAGTTPTKTAYTISWDEQRNQWTSFYDFHPDGLICFGNKLITWLNGNIYVHDNTNAYNTFYGTAYNSSIEIVANEGGGTKKDFTYIGYTSPTNSVWTAPNVGDVNTSLGQQSNLVSSDFDNREGMWNAAFVGDSNSSGGLVNGDYLKGEWIDITLQNSSVSLTFLYALYISFLDSPKNY